MIDVLVALGLSALILGFLIWRDRVRPTETAQTRAIARWLSFGAGVWGVLSLAAPMIDSALSPDGVDRLGRIAPWLFPNSLVLGVIALAVGGYALAGRDRSWQTWVGLVAGALVALFWLLFAVGYALAPAQ